MSRIKPVYANADGGMNGAVKRGEQLTVLRLGDNCKRAMLGLATPSRVAILVSISIPSIPATRWAGLRGLSVLGDRKELIPRLAE